MHKGYLADSRNFKGNVGKVLVRVILHYILQLCAARGNHIHVHVFKNSRFFKLKKQNEFFLFPFFLTFLTLLRTKKSLAFENVILWRSPILEFLRSTCTTDDNDIALKIAPWKL